MFYQDNIYLWYKAHHRPVSGLSTPAGVALCHRERTWQGRCHVPVPGVGAGWIPPLAHGHCATAGAEAVSPTPGPCVPCLHRGQYRFCCGAELKPLKRHRLLLLLPFLCCLHIAGNEKQCRGAAAGMPDGCSRSQAVPRKCILAAGMASFISNEKQWQKLLRVSVQPQVRERDVPKIPLDSPTSSGALP